MDTIGFFLLLKRLESLPVAPVLGSESFVVPGAAAIVGSVVLVKV